MFAPLLASPQPPSSRKSHRRASRGILVALGIRLVQPPSLPGSRLAGGWDVNPLVPRGRREKDRCAGLASSILAHGLAAWQPGRPGPPSSESPGAARDTESCEAAQSAQGPWPYSHGIRSCSSVIRCLVFPCSLENASLQSLHPSLSPPPQCRSLGRVGKVSPWQDRMFETLDDEAITVAPSGVTWTPPLATVYIGSFFFLQRLRTKYPASRPASHEVPTPRQVASAEAGRRNLRALSPSPLFSSPFGILVVVGSRGAWDPGSVRICTPSEYYTVPRATPAWSSGVSASTHVLDLICRA